MTQRVEFLLTMPGVASWNGRWSGESKRYAIVRTLPDAKVAALGLPTSYSHGWDDGWRASIAVRVVPMGERLPKSDGFCGYDWMVDNILQYGRTNSCPPHEWGPDTSFEGFERCPKCRTSRKVAPESLGVPSAGETPQ